MATVTGLTADRMLAIEAASVVDGEVVNGNLILTKHDGTPIDAGSVVGPQGPQGPVGPAAVSAIPGEVKLWPGSALPDLALYGKWVWADGAYYPVASHPKAAGHIATQWRTFAGASDPGAANFRVPDLRGLAAVGLDAMPGGARANRMTRSVAITIAGRTGEETHVVTVGEMPAHSHVVNAHSHGGSTGTESADHTHLMNHDHAVQVNTLWEGAGNGGLLRGVSVQGDAGGGGQSSPIKMYNGYTGGITQGHVHSVGAEAPGTNSQGSNGAHENVQPTVFVPYIVFLDVV